MNDTTKAITPCKRCGVMPRQEYLPRKFPNSITLKTECPKCGSGVIHLVDAGPDGASPEKVGLAMEEHDKVWRDLNE